MTGIHLSSFNLMLQWKIEYLANEDLLYIKTCGVMTTEFANTMLAEIVEAAKRHCCKRQLVDHRETEFGFSMVEYYERPRVNQKIGMEYTWRVAMVFAALTEETLFFETVFQNRGYTLRQFDDIEKAKEWVLT